MHNLGAGATQSLDENCRSIKHNANKSLFVHIDESRSACGTR